MNQNNYKHFAALLDADAGIVEGDLPATIDVPDNHRNAPRPSPDCLHGLIGDVARAGSASTEAGAGEPGADPARPGPAGGGVVPFSRFIPSTIV